MKTPAIRPVPALKTLTALALIAALALLLYAAIPIPAGAQTFTDYDLDDDGLIDIDTIAELHGIRLDTNANGVPENPSYAAAFNAAFPNHDTSTGNLMGCPGGVCIGYELLRDLDFATATTSLRNWVNTPYFYTVIFEGNGHTISNLSATTGQNAGLFRTVFFTAVIRNVGLINPSVSGSRVAGALAATNRGTIIASYAQGGSVTVTGGPGNGAGGLVGNMDAPSASIVASWSTASVRAAVTGLTVGGLLARQGTGTIIASYAAGGVSATGTAAYIGGLVGRVNAGTRVNSYCSDATGQSGCLTAAEMQAPTAYTGIYANWNVDLSATTTYPAAFPDNPWDFGTTSTYPKLKTPDQRQADPVVDYDLNDNNLIDIDSLYQLNAIRHDLNGDGLPDAAANYPAYAGAFVNGDLATTTPAAPRMGCPQTCIGYELARNLDFAADGEAVTSTDAYPNWTPIGVSYAAVFDGNGFTISNLTITGASGNSGLFNTLTSGGVIRDVGMIDASISSGGAYIGTLVGLNAGEITASYARDGSVMSIGSNSNAGGLAGLNGGTIQAAYARVSVDSGISTNVETGGLAGLNSGTIIASYAAGRVSGTGPSSDVGGLVGRAHSADAAITDSYCDREVHSTTTPCVGDQTDGASVTVEGKTAAELQTPTGYTGIYANWRVDADGDTFPDHAWNFGTTTTYPVLNTPSQRQAIPAIDYDADDDNLIDLTSQAQLDAIRHDLNGDGLPEAVGDYVAYAAAFLAGDLAATGTRMGCASGCAGYELSGNITLTGDWTPIDGTQDGYAAEFNGNGRTISGLTVTEVSNAGLFGRLGDRAGSGGTIRDLGLIAPLIAPNVSGTIYVGGLVGYAFAGTEITTSYVQGGTAAVTMAGGYAGGLVGFNLGEIKAAYAMEVLVNGVSGAWAGGLTGNNGAGGHIIASYAAARMIGDATLGGLSGRVFSTSSRITDSYCDSTGRRITPCVGAQDGGATATSTPHSSEHLKTPTGYTGIYETWNLDLDGEAPANDYPWNFREATQYPVLNTPTQRQAALAAAIAAAADTLPPPLPRTIPPEPEREYNPAADHPEIYNNAEYEMAATCRTHDVDPETGNPRAATVTFDLGSYTGPILPHLSLWANGRYMAYETQGIALPTLEREGQRATVRIETDPAQTRFRLDGRRHGLAANLLLGYANCQTDDDP